MRTYFLTIFLAIAMQTFSQETNYGNTNTDSIANDYDELFLQPESPKILDHQLLAIAHLNQCIAAIANIEAYKSKLVLEEEYNNIVNNMSMEMLNGYSEVVGFKRKLLSTLNAYLIGEKEQMRAILAYERKKNAAMRDAVNQALNGVYITTNVFSSVANTVLATARTAVDYSAKIDELGVALDEQQWNLETEAMKIITELRIEAIQLSHDLYQKHNLLEKYRITEEEAAELSSICKEINLEIRLQKLLDQKEKYSYYAPYWYFLGDAQINCGKIKEGINSFSEYEKIYQIAPINRRDKMTGLIAMQKLNIFPDTTYTVQQKWISEVMYNLPNDGNAHLFCATVEDGRFNNKEKAIEILRKSIVKEKSSAKSESTLYGIMMLEREIVAHSSITPLFKDFEKAVINTPTIDFDNYLRLAWVGKENQIPTWEKINQIKISASNKKGNIDKMKLEIPLFFSNLKNEEMRMIGFDRKKKMNDVYTLSFDKKNNNRKAIKKECAVFKKYKELIPYFFNSYNDGKFLIPKLDIDIYEMTQKFENKKECTINLSAQELKMIINYFEKERNKTTNSSTLTDLYPVQRSVFYMTVFQDQDRRS